MCCAHGKPQTTTSPRRNFDAQAIDVLGHALEAQGRGILIADAAYESVPCP